MSISMEYEKRVMLNETQYFELVSHYLRQNARYPFIHQTNYYFDTPNLDLKKSHKVLRVRSIVHHGNELTLKCKEKDGDREITSKLNPFQSKKLINKNIFPACEVTDALHELDNDFFSYQLMAKLTTRRLEIKEEDYLVVIDKNEYNGIIDYNLEIEANNKKRAEEVILQFCNKFNLTYSSEYKSKSSRVLESITIN